MSRILIAWMAVIVLMFPIGCMQKHASLVVVCSTFMAGDNVFIEFGDTHTTGWRQTVREDGTIALPLNKSVRVVDKTKSQLEKAIHDIYVPTVLKHLTVRVRGEVQFFFVTGEVKNPGQKEHPGAITVMEAIRAAGNFTDFASKADIEIIRVNGDRVKVAGNAILEGKAKDVPVYPGDAVQVNRTF